MHLSMHAVREPYGATCAGRPSRPGEVIWTKSRRSGMSNNCVELASVRGRMAVRDSKRREQPVLLFSLLRWRLFVTDIKFGRF